MEKKINEKEQLIVETDMKHEPLRLNRYLTIMPEKAQIPAWLIQKVRVTPVQIRMTVICTLGYMCTKQDFIDYGYKFNEMTADERSIIIEDLDNVGNVFIKTTYSDCFFDQERMYDTIQYDYSKNECKSYEIVFLYEESYEEKVGNVSKV